ncbi:hypothetical protein Syun_005438 [Stephania yunnanensis]|uniref:Uncharacterized protein n=1 Tax=Stephania yunnanensis TaxID=152371 RepID=A0AAP0L572_9MAGN
MEEVGEQSKSRGVGVLGLFSFADETDKVLMIVGSIGSCVHGAALSLFFVIFAKVIHSLGSLATDPLAFVHQVSKESVLLVYLGLGILFSAWIGRMREKFLQSVLGRDISFFDMEAKDENIVFCISSDSILVQDAIGDKMGHALRFLSQFLAGFAVAFSQVWKLTLITVAVVPLLAAAGALYAIALSTLSKKGEAAYAEAGKFAEEVISQVRTVYSFVGEDKAVHTYSNLLRNALKLGKKSGFVKGFGLGMMYAVMFCSWGLLIWQASVLVSRHSVDGAKAFMTIANVVYSGFALGQAIPNLADIAKALSFSVNHGKTVAIVGQSGSGKSTIVSLIERFYEPIAGKILLDGHDLKSLQLKWLREQIGLVSQEPALFATTIAKNILFGKEDASMDEIMEAAKVSNAHSFIQSFPNGYDTKVGEGGTLLSGGQKQRIAVARAILRNPKILLLDEATSALDAESELLVQQALNNIMSKRTTIVIAHKMSTIRNVDTIIVLKNGQVFESGNHAELMAKEKAGEYATLVKMQLLSNDENDGQQDSFGTSILEERQNNQTLTKSTDANDIQMSDQEVVSAPSFWKLVKLNKPEWLFALLGSLGAVLTGIQASIFALGVARILELFYLYDDSKTKHESLRIILSFIIMAVFTVPLYLMQHFFCTIMGERLVSRVRLYMFSAMLRNEISWFDMDTNSTGSLISTLAADATLVRSALAERLSSIVQNIAITLSAFAIGYKLCWPLVLVVTATFPLLIAASITEKLFMQGLGGDYSKAYSQAIALAHEAIINIQTVAAFGSEDMITSQFSSELSRSNKWALLRGHITAIGFGMSQCLAFFSYALGLWYSSILIKNHGYKFGDTLKTFIVLIFTANSIADTLGVAPDLVKGTKALESVFRILERRTEIEPNDPTSLELTEVKGNVELKNVIFRYPSRPDVVVLDDFNLKVMAGTSHAIVGHSGCGKSSVIALIMRFYDPTSGTVMIDGLDIRSLNLKSTRLRIGLVQQEPVLFSTSLYDNILYGKDGASEIEIINAAKAANAHEFISRMPDGYHTQAGTQGAQLSGGQKQRVAIARAVLKDPTILLLDEATSALDTTSEKLVQEALNKLMEGRTTIIVAHRLSTIRDVNTISVLQGGKVVETGNHVELTSQPSSIYSQLVKLQQESNAEVSS